MSRRNSGFALNGADEYMTPEWAVRALLKVERVQGFVWEPACGEGAIARVCRLAGATVQETDWNPKFKPNEVGDFLGSFPAEREGWWLNDVRTIITNPPYGAGGRLAEKFVRRALDLMKPVDGRVIMLLPVDWDSAKTRQDLFEDFPGRVSKVVLTSRIRWTNLKQKKAGPSQNHAWFVWDWKCIGRGIRWVGREKDDG